MTDQKHRARLEQTNHGCYFADCSCGWAGGVHSSRQSAKVAHAAHRDGLPKVEPIKPVFLFRPPGAQL